MFTAVLESPRRFVLRESEIPRVDADQLLIQVRYCGICGSDLHTFQGRNPFVRLPAVLGHEMIGEVLAVGSSVQQIRVGDRVTYEPTNHCGSCRYCAAGLYNLCPDRTPTVGAFREFTVLPERQVHKVPESISDKTAVLIEPLASALHALDVAHLQEGQRILIIGCGTVGLLLAAAARLRNAGSVAVANRSLPKLQSAVQFGADVVIHTPESDSVERTRERVKERVGEHNLDLVLDTVCSDETIGCAMMVLKRGGTLVIVGTPPQSMEVDLSRIFTGELKLTASLKYRNNFPEAIGRISRAEFDYSALVTEVIPLVDIQVGFERILANSSRFIKCLIAPQPGS